MNSMYFQNPIESFSLIHFKALLLKSEENTNTPSTCQVVRHHRKHCQRDCQIQYWTSLWKLPYARAYMCNRMLRARPVLPCTVLRQFHRNRQVNRKRSTGRRGLRLRPHRRSLHHKLCHDYKRSYISRDRSFSLSNRWQSRSSEHWLQADTRIHRRQ